MFLCNFGLLQQYQIFLLHKARTPVYSCFNIFAFTKICFDPSKCVNPLANSDNFITIENGCHWPKLLSSFPILISGVIYKRVVSRKIRLTRRFSFISFIEINKINKRMEYLSRLTGGYLVASRQLIWSGLTVLSGDALSDGWGFNCSCDLRLPYSYISDFKHRL